MPASAGKTYTLLADVLVTSGFAKIELDFLDVNGSWLTNNTLPLSGVSATSTTGSVQYLSASWLAPTNTTSVIIRLINNVSGGIAQFDNIKLTNWESPVAAYGTDPYYPDQLTARTGNQDRIGVLSRQGNSSSYTLVYSGFVKPTPTSGYVTCYHYATMGAKCKGYGSFPINPYGSTPLLSLKHKICPGTVSKICVNTNFGTKNYAKNVYTYRYVYVFERGIISAGSPFGPPIRVIGGSWTGYMAPAVSLTNVPWHMPLWIYVKYTYDPTIGSRDRTYSTLWELKLGYG